MKKSLPLILAAVCASLLLFTGMAKNKMATVTGYIEYYGNAPFATGALKGDDGTVYALAVAEDSEFTVKDILALQGHHISLDGITEEAGLDAFATGAKKKIIVHSFKDITKN